MPAGVVRFVNVLTVEHPIVAAYYQAPQGAYGVHARQRVFKGNQSVTTGQSGCFKGVPPFGLKTGASLGDRQKDIGDLLSSVGSLIRGERRCRHATKTPLFRASFLDAHWRTSLAEREIGKERDIGTS